MLRNPTSAAFRLKLWLDAERLHGTISADRPDQGGWEVVEDGRRFLQTEGRIYRENWIYRIRGEHRELLAHNLSPVLYEVDPALVEII